MKRFFVEEERQHEVADFLNRNEIKWDNNSKFHFDFKTCVVTMAATALVCMLIAIL